MVIPQWGIQINKWFGYGWQIIDPNSGAAAYLLAGFLTSGGEITSGGSGTREADWSATAIAGALAGLFSYLEYRADIIRALARAAVATWVSGQLAAALTLGAATIFSIVLIILAIWFVWYFVSNYFVSINLIRRRRYA